MSEKAPGGRHGLLLLGVALALGLIISTSIATRSIAKIKMANQTITVKGYAERDITSDWAMWRGTVTARADELVAAYTGLEEDLSIVLDYLKRNGVEKEDVDVSSVSTSIQYKRTEEGDLTNEIEGYVLRQSVEVSSADVALIEGLSKDSTSLIKEGIEFSSHAPEYLYTRLNDLKIEMLGEATENARQRAEQLASKSGSKVGALRSAQQGVFQITQAHSTEVSSYGRYDTSTIEKKIKAVVTIKYSIR